MIRPVEWRNGAVVLLDQRLLPTQEVYRVYRDHRDVARAIKDMVVRGAPAIGVAAAMGIALGVAQAGDGDLGARLRSHLHGALPRRDRRRSISSGRSTACARTFARARGRSPEVAREVLRQEALAIYEEDIAATARSASTARPSSSRRPTVLTHCNAGALATAGYGTALGVVRAAKEAGKQVTVIATETRPFLQGARLTAWELKKDRIPVTLITD